MNFKRILNICNFIIALLIVVLLAGYFLFHPDGSVSQDEDSVLIGASYMTMNNELFAIINEQISHRVDAEGDHMVVRDPALDIDRQVEQIEDMLDMGIRVLILTPVDSDALSDVLRRARRQGVIVIVVDSNLSDSSLADCTIVSDNYRAGVLAGEYLLSKMEEGEKRNIVLFTHDAALSGVQRVKGFKDTVSGRKGIRIVREIPCEGKLELAVPRMESFIEEGSLFDSVFCLNDPSCIGAAAALDSNGLLESVELYGVDASPDVKAMIRDGKIKGSVAQSPTKVGEQAADALYMLLRGQKVDPMILVPVELVTQENVEEHNVDRWQ